MKIEDNIRFIMLRNGTNAQIYLSILILKTCYVVRIFDSLPPSTE